MAPPVQNRIKRKRGSEIETSGNKKFKLDPGPETVLFLPHTPHSELKKLVQATEDRLNNNRATKVKIVERNGNKLREVLCNKTPWRSEACSNTECVACCYAPGSCRKRNVLYRAVCVHCGVKGVSSVYWGESHRAWVDRLAEHTHALKTLNPTYATVRHTLEQHPGVLPLFTYHYNSSHMTSTERQIKESMKI